jgi:hypothetical protein
MMTRAGRGLYCFTLNQSLSLEFILKVYNHRKDDMGTLRGRVDKVSGYILTLVVLAVGIGAVRCIAVCAFKGQSGGRKYFFH